MAANAPFDKVYVVGAGAIGLHMAALFSKISTVTLIGRSKRRTAHFTLNWKSLASPGHVQKIDFPITQWLQIADNALLEDLRSPRTLIVHTTKAYDLNDSLKSIPNFCKGPVLLLQNGLQIFEECKKNFPHLQLVRGSCWFGAILEKLSEQEANITHTGGKKLELGKAQAQEDLALFLNYAGFEPVFFEKAETVEWRKALMNIGLNGLAALSKTHNVETLLHPHLKECFELLITEAFSVATAQGINLGYTLAEAQQTCADGLRATGMNRNSTWNDLEKAKPTEIPWFNGKVVELAKASSLAVPANQLIASIFEKLSNTR